MSSLRGTRSSVFLVYLGLWPTACLFGQIENSLSGFLHRYPQANLIHPAAVPQDDRARWYIGIPYASRNNLYFNNRFSIASVYEKVGEKNFLDLNRLYEGRLGNNNGTHLNMYAIGLFLSHRYDDRLYFSFHTKDNVELSAYYPGDLVTLALRGNSTFVGEQTELKNIVPHVLVNREIGLGAAYKINYQWSAGVILKYFRGLANVRPDPGLSLTLDVEPGTYVHNFEFKNVNIHAAGYGEEVPGLNYFLFNGNLGMGIDLGLRYQPIRPLNIYFSIRDLGFIRWRDNLRKLSIEDDKVSFEGIDLNKSLNFETSGLDSLESKFDVKSFDASDGQDLSYVGAIPQRYFLTGVYDYTRRDHFSASILIRHAPGYWQGTYSLSYLRNLGRRWGTSVSLVRYTQQIISMTTSVFYDYSYFHIYATGGDTFTAWNANWFRMLDITGGVHIVLGRRVKKEGRQKYPSGLPRIRKIRKTNIFGTPRCPPSSPRRRRPEDRY